MAEWEGNSASDTHDVFIKPCIKCGNTDAANFTLISFPSQDDNPVAYVRCECLTEREQLYTYVGPEDHESATPDNTMAQKQSTPTTGEDETCRSKSRRTSRRHNYGPRHHEVQDVPEYDLNKSSKVEFSLGPDAYKDQKDDDEEEEEEADQQPADGISCADAEDIMANMEQVVDRVMRLPCVQCGGRNFAFIQDEKDKKREILARRCTNSHCKNLDGVDDTMSIFDIIAQLSSNQYRAAECQACKNDDPEKFIFEKNEDDELCLRCTVCTKLTLVGNEALLHGQSSDVEEGLQAGTDGYLIVVPPSQSAADAPLSYIECDKHGKTCNFTTQKDADGKIEYIQCNELTRRRRCSSRLVPYYGIKGEDPGRKDPSFPSPRTQIHDLLKLQMGDHFAFHQSKGYWHHGIVVEGCDRRLKVIEYAPEGEVGVKDLLSSRGKIREHWIDVDPKKIEVYRFDYNLKECYAPEVVIQRARKRLGEDNYGLLKNNCEHFARWCKTGTSSSSQVQLFGQYCGTVAKQVLKQVAGALVGGKLMPLPSVGYVYAEVDSMRKDITKAYEQKKKEYISETEYLKIAVKRGVRGSVACVGTVALDILGSRAATSIATRLGAQAGSVMIPIPVAGAIVGATLGYIIFTGIGILVGREVAAKVNKTKK